MNIGPIDLKEVFTLFGECTAVPMLMLLKKSKVDNEQSPISPLIMKLFVDRFNNPNYTGCRPEIECHIKNMLNVGSVDMTYHMKGVACKQIETVRRISDGSHYWIYRFEGFFVPVKGNWGGKQYNQAMKRLTLKCFKNTIFNGKIFLLRGVIDRNKKSPYISKMEFHKIESFDYEKVMGIINN